jgi:uncharacterized hydrophobic protein (TIGR00271 family)
MRHGTHRFGGRFAVIRLTAERKDEVSQEVHDLSWPKRSFYLLVVLSATIAAYGLLSNSVAIVIGAMLVAPLMGPIFGIALSITTGSKSLLRASTVSETFGVVLAVGVPLVIGLLPLRTPLGPEVLSRTEPTLYDILVAVAAGLAGAYALVNTKISPALPGVAISTSLVPPLAACGLCLSDARYGQALGAFLLFFANFIAIEIAAGAVFLISGLEDLSARTETHVRELLRRFGPSLVVLAAMAVFMTHTLVGVVNSRRLSNAIEKNLSTQLAGVTGARISEVDLQESTDGTRVVAVVLTPQQIEPDTVRLLESNLRNHVSRKLRLIVRSLISSDFDKSGPVFLAPEQSLERKAAAQARHFLDLTTSILRKKLQDIPGARLVELRRENKKGATTVEAVVRTPSVIGSSYVAEMQEALQQQEKKPVRVVVRSVMAQDVDVHGPLYARSASIVNMTPYEKWLRERLKTALRNQISGIYAGAEITETFIRSRNGRLIVIAKARIPGELTVGDAERIQTALRDHISPNIDLLMRYSVGADVSALGYLSEENVDRLIGQ